jgi:hypothetical protein
MELTVLFMERAKKFKKIAEFLVAIDKDSKLIEKKDRRKNREGNVLYFIPSDDLAEKLEIGKCYVDELNFDINLIHLWALVEIIEDRQGYSLVVYPNECYWLNKDGSQLFDSFSGNKRIEFIFNACLGFIEWNSLI